MAAIPDSDFYDEFESFALKIDDKPETMDKLRGICESFSLSAGDLICELVAVKSTLKKNLSTVNIEFLEQFERELSKKNKNKSTARTPSNRKSLVELNSAHNFRLPSNATDESELLMNSYCGTPTGKGPQSKRPTGGLSPGNLDERPSKRSSAFSAGLVPSLSGGQSFSPSCNTPSEKYYARSNRGEIVCKFGLDENVPDIFCRKGSSNNVSVIPYDSKLHLSKKYNYMVQKLTNVVAILDEQIEEMGELYKEKGLVDYYSYLVLPVQDCVPVVGRICCDGNGRLNPRSILLEGSRDKSGGMSAVFDVSAVQQFSLFPGQIVVAEGNNITGKSFAVTKIHKGLYPPSCGLPELGQELTMHIAAGPFTTTDNISYDPLTDLLSFLASNPPNVCILFGPFVDAKQPLIENGNVDITYEALFESQMRSIAEVTQKHNIHLIIVPSQRDIHHEPVYPQPPFMSRIASLDHVHMMPDPCTININGVVIGLTSTDILFHIGAEETFASAPGGTDRISRLIEHVLTQHSYYPLYPPALDVNLDLEHFDIYGKLPVTPHILLLPSDLRPFIKSVGETVCVNPGHLVKGQVGGTFARVSIKSKSATAGGNSDSAESVGQLVCGEIQRI